MEEEEENLLLLLMEHHSDSVIPPFSELNHPTIIKQEENEETPISKISYKPPSTITSRKKPRLETASSSTSEKDRRQNIAQHYSLLLQMVPNLIPKEARATIIEATIDYIKELEGVVEGLEKKKREACVGVQRKGMLVYSGPTWSVKVIVSGNVGVFGLFFERGMGFVAKVLMVFEKNQAQVMMATSHVHGEVILLNVSAMVDGGRGDEVFECIKKDILVLLA